MNQLASETSPYLLQHAANPVDWHPWNEAALARARDENKPILLSIGYSACHWCHVMAHESFEDPATAEVMNRHFVNIKVDREERPDLDKIYQTAHHFIAQRGGGWPLTMFLTPGDHVPFFGGTYFPNTAKYGMPSFTQVLERVAGYYRDHAADVRCGRRSASWSPGSAPARPPSTASHSPTSGRSRDNRWTGSMAASAAPPSSPTPPPSTGCCATGAAAPMNSSPTRTACSSRPSP
jgi:uncharacterized protein